MYEAMINLEKIMMDEENHIKFKLQPGQIICLKNEVSFSIVFLNGRSNDVWNIVKFSLHESSTRPSVLELFLRLGF